MRRERQKRRLKERVRERLRLRLRQICEKMRVREGRLKR